MRGINYIFIYRAFLHQRSVRQASEKHLEGSRHSACVLVTGNGLPSVLSIEKSQVLRFGPKPQSPLLSLCWLPFLQLIHNGVINETPSPQLIKINRPENLPLSLLVAGKELSKSWPFAFPSFLEEKKRPTQVTNTRQVSSVKNKRSDSNYLFFFSFPASLHWGGGGATTLPKGVHESAPALGPNFKATQNPRKPLKKGPPYIRI